MDLPKDYKNKFISLLDELEQKTGNLYQLDIQQFNVTEKITLNEFSSRSCQVEVYNMIHPYQKLNGIYPNLSAVNEKIKQLHNMEKEKRQSLFQPCRYETEYNATCYNCQNATYFYHEENEWTFIVVDKFTDNIYTKTGDIGMISMVKSCGTYRFIK